MTPDQARTLAAELEAEVRDAPPSGRRRRLELQAGHLRELAAETEAHRASPPYIDKVEDAGASRHEATPERTPEKVVVI